MKKTELGTYSRAVVGYVLIRVIRQPISATVPSIFLSRENESGLRYWKGDQRVEHNTGEKL